MDGKKGIADRAAATAALAGQLAGIPLGEQARALAERHSADELREMSRSEAAEEARAEKARRPDGPG